MKQYTAYKIRYLYMKSNKKDFSQFEYMTNKRMTKIDMDDVCFSTDYNIIYFVISA